MEIDEEIDSEEEGISQELEEQLVREHMENQKPDNLTLLWMGSPQFWVICNTVSLISRISRLCYDNLFGNHCVAE